MLNRENNINTKEILKEEFNAEMALKKASLIKPEMGKIDKLMSWLNATDPFRCVFLNLYIPINRLIIR